jgi:deazaflavin-dependent oxidoreductase (nitroreductase family)
MATYDRPDWATKHIFNPLVALATKLGLSMRGSRVLAHRGRKSGKTFTTPVNPLDLDGARYLVAPRGNTEWSRNVRAAAGGELRLGRKREQFTAKELTDDEKPPVLRAYLKIWKSETGKWFEGRDESSSDEDLRTIAPDHPVFRIESVDDVNSGP